MCIHDNDYNDDVYRWTFPTSFTTQGCDAVQNQSPNNMYLHEINRFRKWFRAQIIWYIDQNDEQRFKGIFHNTVYYNIIGTYNLQQVECSTVMFNCRYNISVLL